MKKTSILIANVLIVFLILSFTLLYVRNDGKRQVRENIENFTTMTLGMEQVTANYLEGEQRLCDSWSMCINYRRMSMEEAMSFLSVAQIVPSISAHVIRLDTLEGFSNQPKTNDSSDYSVSYKNIGLFSSPEEFLANSQGVHITRTYTNPMNGVQSIAFCNSVTLRGPENENVPAIIMRVVPLNLLSGKWIFPTEKYDGAQISMIDFMGNYIIKGKSFKNSNFLEFYKSYNTADYEKMAELEKSVREQGFFEMKNSRGEDCLIVHVPVNTSFGWTLLTYVPMSSIAKNNLDWILISVVSVGLLLLLILDLLVFMMYNKKLADTASAAESANRAKTDFLSTMSHDIRTPMNAIIGLTTIAEKNVGDPGSTSDNLKKIRLASNHLLTLINDILDISKVESGRLNLSPVTFSIVDSAENLVNISQPMVRQKNIDFRFRCKNIKNEFLFADRLRIDQIFINILSNALKYTPEGKKVYVDLCEYPCEKKGFVTLSYTVTDSGMGMTKEFMEKMYQPFSRETDSRINTIQGTGLGLAITKKMVDLMDGTIGCDSEVGRGTRFTVTLDIMVSDTPEEEMRLPDIRVLVIDDDEILLKTARDTLHDLGTTVDVAGSGESALEKISSGKNESRFYNVIILDWKMPGMSGIELTKKIRQIAGKDIPILLVSAYDWSDIEEDAKKAGVSGFITKPLFRSSLCKKISDVLGLEKEETESDEQTADLADMSVLVAEDMDVNWEIISTLLEMYGIKSTRAENGKIAVDMIRDKACDFDVIFMDIQMPVMNGLDATREIRKLENPQGAEIPIIAMTADAFSENVTECMEAGMNGHIAKPIDIKQVIKELQKIKQAKSDFSKESDYEN